MPRIGVGHSVTERVVDQHRDLARRRGDRLDLADSRGQPPVKAPSAVWVRPTAPAASRTAAPRPDCRSGACGSATAPEILLCGARPSQEAKCWALGQAARSEAALADQLERQVGTDPIDLGQVDPEDHAGPRTHRHRRLVDLRLRATGRRQRRRRGWALGLQALQYGRNALVAGGHLGLVDLIQLQRLGQGEDVLLVVADQRGAQGRERVLQRPSRKVARRSDRARRRQGPE